MTTRRHLGGGTAGPNKPAHDRHPYQFACQVNGCRLKLMMPKLPKETPHCRMHPDTPLAWYYWPGKDNGEQPPQIGRS